MLIVANLVDLSAIASVGSAVSLMVFLLVGLAGWRRRADTNSNPVIVVLAIAVTAIVLGFFAVDTLQTAPETFTAIILLALAAIALDAIVRRHRGAPHPPEGQPAASASPASDSTAGWTTTGGGLADLPRPSPRSGWTDTTCRRRTGRRLIKHPRYPVTLRLWVSYQPPYAQVKAGFYGLHL